MTRDKKLAKDTPASKLLEDFVDSDLIPDDSAHRKMSDDEYIEMMLRKEAERKTLRSRRDKSLSEETHMESENEVIPEIPEGSCPSCYYCTIIRRIGSSVYCVCANPKRTIDGMYYDYRIWVKSELDLACHREPPLRGVQKLIIQKVEEQHILLEPNIPGETNPEEKYTISDESESVNLFDDRFELVERVDDTPDIEDPDVPNLNIRPPERPKMDLESELRNIETLSPEEIAESPDERVDTLFREETIAVYKHRALETLEKYRKERPLDQKQSEVQPIVSEKMAPMRNCESCYFCVNNKRIGGSSWVHCTNIVRSADSVTAASWVKSKLNAACWKRPESL
ncbi:MAG: hypothetical protein ACFFF9_00535 [Candidatus Thorarchaeota archaeon]